MTTTAERGVRPIPAADAIGAPLQGLLALAQIVQEHQPVQDDSTGEWRCAECGWHAEGLVGRRAWGAISPGFYGHVSQAWFESDWYRQHLVFDDPRDHATGAADDPGPD